MKNQNKSSDKGENAKQESFAEKVTVTPVTIKLQVDDVELDDTDPVIDEDKIEKKDVLLSQVQLDDNDEDDDIPLSQIHHGERMVNYRASK